MATSTAPRGQTQLVATLGAAQTLAWASSYYLPAVLAPAMAQDLGLATPTVFGAFSGALVVSALVGPLAGRSIDRLGGRPVLMATNGLFALGLVLLALAQGPGSLFAAWAVLGLAMGAGLYDGAFAALVRLQGPAARGAITGITLIAGFASTVGWPLTAWMEAQIGWRGACATWAALHLLLGLPLNAGLPRLATPTRQASAAALPAANAPLPASPASPAHPALTTGLLAAFFALSLFVGTAMATHLPQLLQAVGATLAVAVGVGALIGPAQVAARLLEFSLLRRVQPLLSARLSSLAHPAGIAALLLLGPAAAAPFALLHGAGNGILTIVKGSLPLTVFGAEGYGARQGWLMLPARVAQAAAPFAFGLALEAWGARALWLSGGLGLLAFGALMALPRPDRRAGHPPD